jgi:hypothetical protein
MFLNPWMVINLVSATAAATSATAKNQYRFLLRSILINNKRKLTINIIGTTIFFCVLPKTLINFTLSCSDAKERVCTYVCVENPKFRKMKNYLLKNQNEIPPIWTVIETVSQAM